MFKSTDEKFGKKLCSLTYGWVGHDDHDICVWSEDVNKGSEAWVVYLHTLDRGCQFTAAQLELFNYVADLLKPVHVYMCLPLTVGDHLQKQCLITVTASVPNLSAWQLDHKSLTLSAWQLDHKSLTLSAWQLDHKSLTLSAWQLEHKSLTLSAWQLDHKSLTLSAWQLDHKSLTLSAWQLDHKSLTLSAWQSISP